ncbi:helix-turn-helix transcriptional regulator [Bailinhaonella thermotolerans]|uniref:MarR family transcriptional regulator n=1 Tax=Bailinhaonella thermotolerans TaxID=1070861 RepID=A0A3A4A6Q0_9ACTN|nr:MarR family transcriptional regulator [Bailinhaonella thermotolerans]RJL24245.1 MarR family transcriptional regulator [Bailinhaonella thermotolerans]
MDSLDGRPASRWTFLTNHARVLLEIARDPNVRLRDIAASIGITERAAQSIVSDLEEAGYLTRIRVGRRNHYNIDRTRRFRHPSEADMRIDGLIEMFTHRDTLGEARAQDEQRLNGDGPRPQRD